MTVPKDYKAKNKKVSLAHKGDRQGNAIDNNTGIELTENYYDQNRKLFSNTIHQHEIGYTQHVIVFIEGGEEKNLNVNFNDTTIIFEMMTYELRGKKYYVNEPPIYIKHTDFME